MILTQGQPAKTFLQISDKKEKVNSITCCMKRCPSILATTVPNISATIKKIIQNFYIPFPMKGNESKINMDIK